MENDMELAKLIQNGDENAFKTFYDENFDALYRFIYYRVEKNKNDAEDILQETIMDGIKSIKKFKGKSSLFAWFCGIAKHKISKFYRNQNKKILQIDSILNNVEEKYLTQDEINNNEIKEIINLVLSSLPPHYQKCLVKKYIEEKTVKSIADEFNMSEDAVESMIRRAKEAFKIAFNSLKLKGEIIK